MSKTPKNNKYLEIENVRAYYNEKEDSIQLITKDPDLKGKTFQITLKNGTESEQSLRNLLKEKDVISRQEEKSGLPKFVHYPTHNNQKFSKIPGFLKNAGLALVGETYGNKPYTVNLKNSRRILISGRSGYGKNILIQNFMLQALKYDKDYSIIGIDHGYTMDYLTSFRPGNLIGISHSSKDMATVLDFVRHTMEERKKIMMSEGFDNFEEYSTNSPNFISRRIILVINDLDMLLRRPFNYSAEEQVEREAQYEKTYALLTEILNDKEDKGITVIANSSMPNLPEEIAESFDTKILMGATEKSETIEFFKEETPTTSGLRGEALIKVQSNLVEMFQVYYSHEETFAEIIDQQVDQISFQ